MKGLAGSTVWWPGTDSDLGEPGRGNTLQASRHHLSLELAVPWAMQEAWSGPNSKNSRPSRGRGNWVVLRTSRKVLRASPSILNLVVAATIADLLL